MNNCFKGLSLFFIIIFNAIIASIDLLVLIISIILLVDNKHNLGDIVAVILLVYGIIILPFVCCGVSLIFTLFRINKNNILQARVLGTFNILLMVVILILNIHSSTFLNKGGFILVIFNILCIISIIYLCFNKMGYKKPHQRHQDINMDVPRSIDEEYNYNYNGNPAEIDIIESTDDEKYYEENFNEIKRKQELQKNMKPSAPYLNDIKEVSDNEVYYPQLYGNMEEEGECQITIR